MLGIFRKYKKRNENQSDYCESVQEDDTEQQEYNEEVTLEQVQEVVSSLKEKAENGDVQAMQWLGDMVLEYK